MARKIFKNLDEQIEILEGKGLLIRDVNKTKRILLKENYFFINGYRHLFLQETKKSLFIPGTTFEELYGTFIFDRRLRNVVFKNIQVIENNLKSILSYTLSKKYGIREKDYLKPKNFTSDALRSRQVNDVISKMKRQIRVNGRKHQATTHYIENYGYIPMWVLVKVLSFGLVSELYSILKHEEKEMIANFYNISSSELGIYLQLLSNFRNISAHEDILYTHRTQRSISANRYHSLLSIEKNEEGYIYGENDLFALVIMLKELLSDVEFRSFIYEIGYEIDVLAGKIKTISINEVLKAIGFPQNWRDIINL